MSTTADPTTTSAATPELKPEWTPDPKAETPSIKQETPQPCPMSSSLDINSSASAVLEWIVDDLPQYFSDPDPRSGDIVLESRYRHASSSASFKIRIPIQLKGIDNHTQVILVVHPCSIASLECETSSVVPEAVREKLDCSTVCLRFRLRDPVVIVVPAAAPIPLLPKRRPSGEVLDALRLLSQATSIAVYVPAWDLPASKVGVVRDALSNCRLRPMERLDDVSSLYGGAGGKIIDMATCFREGPPSYDALEPPPPMAPLLDLDHKHDVRGTKRQRLLQSSHERVASSEAIDSRFDAIWSELIKMRKEKAEYEDRIRTLEGRVEQLEKQKQAVEQELATVRQTMDDANDGAQVAEADILELRQGLEDLEEQVDDLRQTGVDSDVEDRITDRVTENVTERVLDNIFGQSLNTTITFERPHRT